MSDDRFNDLGELWETIDALSPRARFILLMTYNENNLFGKFFLACLTDIAMLQYRDELENLLILQDQQWSTACIMPDGLKEAMEKLEFGIDKNESPVHAMKAREIIAYQSMQEYMEYVEKYYEREHDDLLEIYQDYFPDEYLESRKKYEDTDE